ncbi:MAG: hypothetical protein JRG68_06415 [Deltaproteobacteria bacterium]|nr:hypothetical protein [Deltaproteobacteria bacterium]MBW2100384.1 hypothetical protein [Deltaproteobacteria bacterium]
MTNEIEKRFLSLPVEDRETIISYGASIRLTILKKRLFLAEQKIRNFEVRYKTTLRAIEAEGIPDDASYEFHEDYVEWHHWEAVVKKCKQEISSIQAIAQQGVHIEEYCNVSC